MVTDIIKNVGIVGSGLSATIFHAPFIQNAKGLKLIAFLKKRHGQVNGYEHVNVYTWNEINAFLEHVDVVIITTPSDTHYEIAKIFLNHKKNVVVEKPFTLNTEQALDLIKDAENANVLLSVYHNRRWDGDFKTIHELFKRNVDIGRIVEFESSINRFKMNVLESEWRESDSNPGNGILYDLGSHLIDQALVLCGTSKVLVSGFVRNHRQVNQNVDDYSLIILEFLNPDGTMGTIVHLKTSLVAKISGPRFIIHGDKGSAIIYGFDPQEEQLLAGKRPWDEDYGLNEKRVMIVSANDDATLPIYRGDWTGFYDALFNALNDQCSPDMVHVKEALNVVKITEAVKKSYALGIKIEVDL